MGTEEEGVGKDTLSSTNCGAGRSSRLAPDDFLVREMPKPILGLLPTGGGPAVGGSEGRGDDGGGGVKMPSRVKLFMLLMLLMDAADPALGRVLAKLGWSVAEALDPDRTPRFPPDGGETFRVSGGDDGAGPGGGRMPGTGVVDRERDWVGVIERGGGAGVDGCSAAFGAVSNDDCVERWKSSVDTDFLTRALDTCSSSLNDS